MESRRKGAAPTLDYVEACIQNYIWLLHSPTAPGQVVAVDPGDAAPVEAFLAAHDLSLAAILVTHHHWDHVNGVEALVARWRCPVWGPATEPAPVQDHALREGDTVAVAGLEFRVLDIPGHTAGHIAYVGHGLALVGDTLFCGGCGRLFEGTAAQMHASLTKLAALPPATLVYCAHEYTVANLRFACTVEPGNARLAARLDAAVAQRARGEPTVPSTLADELATNPFLRVAQAEIQVAAAEHAGLSPKNPVEVFATVRLWKDTSG